MIDIYVYDLSPSLSNMKDKKLPVKKNEIITQKTCVSFANIIEDFHVEDLWNITYLLNFYKLLNIFLIFSHTK